MDGWNTSFLLGWLIFRGELAVSFREAILFMVNIGKIYHTCDPMGKLT